MRGEAGSDSWWLKPRQMSLLLLQLGSMVAPGRGTEEPSGSGNALDVLAEPQSSSVRAHSSDEVVPLSLLGAAARAQTSSLPSLRLTQPRPDAHKAVTPRQCVAPAHHSWFCRGLLCPCGVNTSWMQVLSLLSSDLWDAAPCLSRVLWDTAPCLGMCPRCPFSDPTALSLTPWHGEGGGPCQSMMPGMKDGHKSHGGNTAKVSPSTVMGNAPSSHGFRVVPAGTHAEPKWCPPAWGCPAGVPAHPLSVTIVVIFVISPAGGSHAPRMHRPAPGERRHPWASLAPVGAVPVGKKLSALLSGREEAQEGSSSRPSSSLSPPQNEPLRVWGVAQHLAGWGRRDRGHLRAAISP